MQMLSFIFYAELQCPISKAEIINRLEFEPGTLVERVQNWADGNARLGAKYSYCTAYTKAAVNILCRSIQIHLAPPVRAFEN